MDVKLPVVERDRSILGWSYSARSSPGVLDEVDRRRAYGPDGYLSAKVMVRQVGQLPGFEDAQNSPFADFRILVRA